MGTCAVATGSRRLRLTPRSELAEAPRAEHAATAAWSQASSRERSEPAADVLEDLAELNRRYEARFGYIFIVCATGQVSRGNAGDPESNGCRIAPEDEITLAAAEQAKITRTSTGETRPMSPITTHVLDTSTGKPAPGVAVMLEIQRWTRSLDGAGPRRSRTRTDGSPLSIHRLRPSNAQIYRLRFFDWCLLCGESRAHFLS